MGLGKGRKYQSGLGKCWHHNSFPSEFSLIVKLVLILATCNAKMKLRKCKLKEC